jgi:hypothetical protein
MGTTCSAATPVPTPTPLYSSPFEPGMITTGGEARVFHSGDTQWRRWTGVSWVLESVPWPASLANLSPQLISTSTRPRRLPNGDSIVGVVTPPQSNYFTHYDGTAMSKALLRPNATNFLGWTATSDGDYHVLINSSNPAIISGDAVNGWGSPQALGTPNLSSSSMAELAVTPDDRLVVFYAAGSPRHLYTLSKPLGGNWTTPVDLTPAWQADAKQVKVVSTADGIVVGVEATNGPHPTLWTSGDGINFTDESLSATVGARLLSLSAECISAPAVVLGGITQHLAYAKSSTTWTALGDLALVYIDGSSLRVLPDGTTVWGLQYSNDQIDLRAAP